MSKTRYRDLVWVAAAGPASPATVYTYEPGDRERERYHGSADDCEEIALAYQRIGHHRISEPGEGDSLRDLSRTPDESAADEPRPVGRPRLAPQPPDDARPRTVTLTNDEWHSVLRHVSALRTVPAVRRGR